MCISLGLHYPTPLMSHVLLPQAQAAAYQMRYELSSPGALARAGSYAQDAFFPFCAQFTPVLLRLASELHLQYHLLTVGLLLVMKSFNLCLSCLVCRKGKSYLQQPRAAIKMYISV